MTSPKSRRFGAVVVTRYRDGTCTATCNRADCRAYTELSGWRRTLRMASEHAAAHNATEARYANTPWGIPAHELPPTRRRPVRRLVATAAILAVMIGAGVVASNAASHAISPPTTSSPAQEYIPTPAGPPTSTREGR
jgi:hypothetical protein